MKTVLLLVSVAISVASCEKREIDVNYVKSTVWQWDKGFKIGDGDFVDFDTINFYTLSNDTIFKEGIPRCIIIKANKTDYLMTIKSISGEIGYYIDTEEFTK